MNYGVGKKADIRGAYGDALLDLGSRYDKLVVLGADLAESLKTGKFAEMFPERYIDSGISEADMQSTAAGYALGGCIPVTNTFGVFVLRSAEQIRQGIAYPNLNVKVVGSHGGITVGEDGASHQAIEDIAIMRAMPNFVVLSPSDAVMTYRATEAMVGHAGPVYLRLMRSSLPVLYEPNFRLDLEKGNGFKPRDYGKNVVIISTGYLTHKVLEASDRLHNKGIDTMVIDVPTIKPLPEDIIMDVASTTRGIVTAEDHNIIGGLGSAVAELLSEKYPTQMRRVGVRDTYAESGPAEALLKKYHMGVDDICSAAKELL